MSKFRVYVCVCNYSFQTTEPISIKIIPANRASYADFYRLLRFEIFTPTIFITPKNYFWGPRNVKPMEIHVEDSCNVHSKIDRKIFTVYGSNDMVQPKDGPFWGNDDE